MREELLGPKRLATKAMVSYQKKTRLTARVIASHSKTTERGGTWFSPATAKNFPSGENRTTVVARFRVRTCPAHRVPMRRRAARGERRAAAFLNLSCACRMS